MIGPEQGGGPSPALWMLRRAVLTLVAALSLLGVILSYCGALHPAGDSLAIFAPVFGLTGLLTAFLLGKRILTLGFALWLAAQSWAVLAPTGPAGDFAIYQKNLWYRNADLPALADDILASGADVVTLQELSDWNAPILRLLAKDYPHQHVCQYSRWSDLAVLSKAPFVKGSGLCSDARALAVVKVVTRRQPVWVASIHLPWPYPYNQAARLRLIEPMLDALDGPVVIGADLNMFPATRPSRRIARLTGTRELRPLWPTLYLRDRWPMFIDHILAAGGTVERRDLFGSDHYGLLGQVVVEHP